MQAAQERGQLFLAPGVQVYEGMIVGQNAKAEDLVVNVCKEKRLSNMRSKVTAWRQVWIRRDS